MPTKRFQRQVEDFECERCKLTVIGDGYTNHCSNCLWSKHVDEHPGDRKAACKGLMEPFELEVQNGNPIIIHRCLKCGVKKRNRTGKRDNIDKIIHLSVRHKK